MHIRAYLRASTDQQDANRARASLVEFAKGNNVSIANYYTENESGRIIKRPELMRLLDDASAGDVILIESIDRLTRLTADDWAELKLMIESKKLHIVAVDVPTSHGFISTSPVDEMTAGILKAINNMLVDILAVMACKDYELRRQRSEQGTAKAKAEGKYKGRPENKERNAGIAKMLDSGATYSEIQAITGASRATIAKVKKNSLELV